jgi:acetone carboxylase gamma subunit
LMYFVRHLVFMVILHRDKKVVRCLCAFSCAAEELRKWQVRFST